MVSESCQSKVIREDGTIPKFAREYLTEMYSIFKTASQFWISKQTIHFVWIYSKRTQLEIN